MSQNEEGRLTTHVLDTSLGQPASGMVVMLYRLDPDGERTALGQQATNADGRCDSPLIAGEDFAPGPYEIVFAAGPYLAATMPAGSAAPFFDDIAVRFSVAEIRHYHVPLLLSPYGYSTYRGS